MLASSLIVTLTAESRPGHYLLSWGMTSYSIEFRPETDVILGDLLRRLQPVLVGGHDSSEKLASSELLLAVGTRLWQALLPEAASAENRDALENELRTRSTPLLLALPANLATLPWELLCDQEAPDGTGFLGLRRPLVRLIPGGTHLSALTPPLRVLLLISSPLGLEEGQRIDIESERAAVESATRDAREAGLLHLLVEDIVTPRRVQQVLLRFKPHLVHYIGHGGYDEDVGGYLVWEDEQGDPLPLTDSRLADLLRPRGLRGVLLHGCKTASTDSRTEFRSIAGALLGAGIPAVLAQQANFTYESSQRASESFYTALTAGLGLADATFEARQTLALSGRPDWAVPSLQATLDGLAPLLDADASPSIPDPTLAQSGAAADLPTPTGVFVGRQRELRALRTMLESAPGSGTVLALITGPGGVGKSTLVAQAVIRYGGRYKATLTLSCVGFQGLDLFLRRIGEFLQRHGVPEFLEEILSNPKLSITAKIEAAIENLNKAGPLLLVVDNLESVQHEDHTLTDPDFLLLLQKLLTNLRSGRVLITGRYAVEGLLPYGKFAAHLLHLDLDDLSTRETEQLLECHYSLAQLHESVRAELIQALGGLPYIYDLLSSQAATHNLAALINDAQGRITREHQQRTAAEWQRVRRQVIEFATLETSVAQLPESARKLLAQLSIFRRPFSQEALEQGLGAVWADWQPLLDWALLRYDLGEKQYRLHSLTVHFAQGLLDASVRRTTQIQLAEWYVHTANNNSHNLTDYLEAHYLFRAAGEIQRAGALANTLAEMLDRLGLYELWQHLCRVTIGETQGQLAAEALRQLGIIAESQGKYEEAQHLFQEALAAFDLLNDQAGRALTLHQLTNIAHDQGRYEEMDRMCHQLLAIYRQQGDTRGLARTLYQLGTTAHFQGDYEKAQKLCEESMAIFEQLSDQNGRAAVLGLLGLIAQFRGEYEQARVYCSDALAISEQGNNQDGRADSLHLLGMIAQASGDYEQALRSYRESLAIKEQLGKIRGRADTLGQLGNITSLQGKYDEARRWYGEALRFYEQMGHLRGKAIIIHQLGILAQRQGQDEEAQHLLEESLALKKQLGDQRELAATLHQLGSVAEDQGKYEQAMEWYNESLTLKKQLGDRDGCARTLGQLGNMAERRGDYENAMQLYEESSMLFDQLCNQAGRSGVLHALGNIAYLQGEYEKAEGFYRESLALSEQLGHQRECALTLGQLGLLAEKKEDYHQALACMAQALMIFRNLQVPERQIMLDQITKLRVALGEDTFTALWQEVTEGQASLDLPILDNHQQLLQALTSFLHAPTPAEGLDLIEKCPDLLTVEADAFLEKLAIQQQDEDMRHVIEQRRKLLTRCREEGIAAAFAEL